MAYDHAVATERSLISGIITDHALLPGAPMPTIRIRRSHQLPHDEVCAHVEELAAELQQQLDADYHWEDDTLCFSRTGANGFIAVKPDTVEVEVKLSMMLSPFKGKVEKAVTDYLDKTLA
jgi:putative polyhydroxyalkanoate system protein